MSNEIVQHQQNQNGIAPRAERTLGIRNGNGGLQLETMQDIVDFARVVHESGLAPKGLDTPQKVFVAVNMGTELGLSPMAAVQNIGVINGKPGIYGSIALGLVRASGKMAEFDEWLEDAKGNRIASLPMKPEPDVRAVCMSRRTDSTIPTITSFSWGDAMKAGLTGKQGPWSQYPARMLQFRARGFNLADNFPEILKGVKTTEELEDYPQAAAVNGATPTPVNSLAERVRSSAERTLGTGTPETVTAPASSAPASSEAAPESTPAAITPEQLQQYDDRRAYATELGLTPPGALKLDADPRKLAKRTELLENMIAEQEALQNAPSESPADIPTELSEDEKRAILDAEAAANKEPVELPKHVLKMLGIAEEKGLPSVGEPVMLEAMAEVTFSNTEVEVPQSLATMTQTQTTMAALDIKAGRLNW